MAHPYRGVGGGKAKMKRMLGQAPGTNVGKFSDAPMDEGEIDRHLGGYDIRMPGGVEKSKIRLDRRARGGRTHHKGKGHTTVNVLVGGQRGAPQPTPVPVPVPGAGGGPPMPPPRPPMAGPVPGAAPPMGGPMGPGGPPMPPPGMMPPRKRGGVVGDVIASGTHKPEKVKRGITGWKEPRAKPKGNRP